MSVAQASINAFPRFRPNVIWDALFAQLKTVSYPFVTFSQRATEPQNVDISLQPYICLLPLGASQLENQAQGLERWIFEYVCLIYLRIAAVPEAVPAKAQNDVLFAVVNAMRSPQPLFQRQTLGGLVDNAWIEGSCIFSGGINDEQLRVAIPIKVDIGG